MCALAVLGVLLGGPALAATPSASVQTTVKSETGNTGLSSTTGDSSATFTNSLSLSSGSALGALEARAGVDHTDADYDRYVLTDRSGNQTLLSQSFSRPEDRVRAGATYYGHTDSIALDGDATAGPTPFPGYAGKLKATHAVPAYGSQWELGVSRSDHALPFSYFVDPDTFVTKVRPGRDLEDRADMAVEQILSETLKVRADLFAVEKPGSRPLERGLEVSGAHAVSDGAALVARAGLAREKGSDPLFDDRGYFGATWGELEYRIEPGFHWDLGLKIGTVLETETARGAVPARKVGTDYLAVHMRSHWRFGDAGLDALGERSNTGYRAIQIGGNLAWNL